MLINLQKVYDGKIANKYAAKYIEGTKLDGGEVWTKAFFANQKDLVQKLSDFAIGDDVNVVLQNNGGTNYKIVDFKEVTEEDRAKLGGGRGGKPAAAATAAGPAVRSNGTSRGADTNRSAAIYLAKDIVMSSKDAKVLAKTSVPKLLDEILACAETVFDYISEGLLPAPADGIVEDRDDALEPPSLD